MIDVFIIHLTGDEVVDFEVNFLFQKSFGRRFSEKFQKFFKIFFEQESDVHHALRKLSKCEIYEALAALGIAEIQRTAKLQKPFIHKGV